MAGPSGYPKSLPHPCGYKDITVYDADDEKAFHQGAQAFRAEQAAAHQSALKGETIKPAVEAKK
jgi:hypothetical protein